MNDKLNDLRRLIFIFIPQFEIFLKVSLLEKYKYKVIKILQNYGLSGKIVFCHDTSGSAVF